MERLRFFWLGYSAPKIRVEPTRTEDHSLTDRGGLTALMWASMEGHVEVARVLLEVAGHFIKVAPMGISSR